MVTKAKAYQRRPRSRIHKVGTDAAHREHLATAFEEIARVIRSGRKGWGQRAVAAAHTEIVKITFPSKTMTEMLEAFIANSGPNAPVLRMMIQPPTVPNLSGPLRKISSILEGLDRG